MRISGIFLSVVVGPLTALANPIARADPLRRIFTFPNNTFIENIRVRSNSDLLVTSMSVNTLFSIDPTVPSPTAPVIHTFPAGTGLMGITETSHDIFAVVTGIWDLAATRAALGSLTVWTVNLRHSSPVVSLITSISNSTIFNGLVTVPGSSKIILAADSAIGAVWKVNIATGAYDIAFSDPLFLPSSTRHLGINGLRTKGNYLYFTNSAQDIFGRVKIDTQGNKIGVIEVLATVPVTGVIYDDFDFDKDGDAWIASHPSEVVEVKTDGSQRVISNSSLLLNPTSAAFGRGSAKEKKTLYVTNGGWFVGNDLVNEGVVAIDTTRI